MSKNTVFKVLFGTMNEASLHLNDKDATAHDSPDRRAWRLKRVRNLANLSREQMCEDGDINRNTLISWENARFGGLTTSGAIKVLAKIKLEGVHCSLDWLMYGIGSEPSVNPIPPFQVDNFTESNEEVVIAYELAFFRSRNLYAVDMVVNDDGMAPQYQENDYVAGKKKMGTHIQTAIGRDCIVQTENGEVLLRNVHEGRDLNTYTLVCNNAAIKKRNFILLDVKLVYAAPVIWHRRKDY